MDPLGESLSIVVPVFNESGVIERVVEGLDREILARFESGEIIVVDDASTDETPRILELLVERCPRLRIERAVTNRGHGPSVRRALDLASGSWIFQIDSDGQFVIRDFWFLWDRRHHADLVLGVRVHRRDPLHRLALSKVVRLVVSLLARRRLGDPNIPFRLIRRSAWDSLSGSIPRASLAPSILMTTGAALRDWRIEEAPVSHLPRDEGRSTLRVWRLATFSLRGLWELAVFRRRLTRPPPRQSPGTHTR